MGMHRIDWVAGAAVLSLLLATACGGGDDSKPSEGAASTPAAAESAARSGAEGSKTVPLDTGAEEVDAVISEGELPKDFPSDIPTFPEATPATSMLIPGRGGLVTFSTDSAVADIVSFYKESLPGQGWTIENVSEADLRTRITATKDGRTADVVAARNGDASEILISLKEAG